MSKLIPISAEAFADATATGTVLVDFGAPWCGPCKALEPLLVQFAEEKAGVLSVVKVDIDAAPELAEAYGIMSVPTVVIFKDGKRVASRSGVMNMDQLQGLAARGL